MQKSPWIAKGSEEGEIVEELAEYMAYCSAFLGNRDSTIMGKLVAVNFYHQQFQNMSLPLSNPYIKGVAQGIKRGHVEKGTQARVRRPLTWGMLSAMQESVGGEGVQGEECYGSDWP